MGTHPYLMGCWEGNSKKPLSCCRMELHSNMIMCLTSFCFPFTLNSPFGYSVPVPQLIWRAHHHQGLEGRQRTKVCAGILKVLISILNSDSLEPHCCNFMLYCQTDSRESSLWYPLEVIYLTMTSILFCTWRSS